MDQKRCPIRLLNFLTGNQLIKAYAIPNDSRRSFLFTSENQFPDTTPHGYFGMINITMQQVFQVALESICPDQVIFMLKITCSKVFP